MRYAVIGAGVLGLTVALRLGQQGHQVLVLEQATVPGGLASSFEVEPGIWLERFYHHIFRTDRSAVGLIKEVGLGERLRWHRPVSTVMVNGVPRQLDSAGSLLRFRGLAPTDRVRMAAAIATIKAMPNPRHVEDSTADAWMRRACGATGHRQVWEPLLKAKFGAAWDQVSMGWLWARIHDRTSELGYLDGGFHQLYAALATHVERSGGTITYGAQVRRISREGGPLAVAWSDASGEHAADVDRIVSTLPPALNARLSADLAETRAGQGPCPPLDAHCLVLALDRPLTGTYWIGTADRPWPFLAVVEHTAMLPPSDYGGRHLVYLGAYREPSSDLPARPVEEQLQVADELLRTLNPAFERSWVTAAWSFHAPFAQPIVDTGFRQRIPGFDTGVPGVFAASMFQVYPHDRGQNYSIELAHRLVAHLDRQPASTSA
jgi:protoporphyrinogen oxidase